MQQPTRLLILATLLISSGFFCNSTPVNYPEPDFASVPMWYDATSKTLKSFERATPNQGTRMTGMASAEALIFFAGETSSVQFQESNIPAFIFKTNTPTEDPAGIIDFGKLQVNKRKHQREYIMGKGGFGGSKTTVATITVDFKKLGNGMYQIVPSAPLEPGEYCFNVGKKAFCFSVLGKGSTQELKEERHPHDPLGEAIYRDIQRKKAKKESATN